MRSRQTIYLLLLAFLFLLPWQTRVVYEPVFLNGQFWEYGSASWYATEVLLWAIILFSAWDRFRQKSFWALVMSREHFKKHWSRLFFIIAILLYALGQIIWSANPAISYQWLFHLLEGVCLFIILSEHKGKSWQLLIALWAGGVGQGVLAAWQFFSQAVTHIPGLGIAPQMAARLGSFVVETGDERWLRAYGSFGSPNILGGYLALVFIIGLLLYLESPPRQKVFYTAGQMVILSGLVLSFSRGAWVAAAVGALGLLVVFYRERKGALIFWNIGKQFIFSLLIVVVLFFLFRPLFTTRFTPSARLEARSITERRDQYHDLVPLVGKNWLVGVGPGAYTAALLEKHPDRSVWNIQPVHNVYLLLLAELGVVGFVLFFWGCLYIARRILGQRWQWLPVLLVLAVLGLFDHWLGSLYVGTMVWWAIFGLGLL